MRTTVPGVLFSEILKHRKGGIKMQKRPQITGWSLIFFTVLMLLPSVSFIFKICLNDVMNF